MAIYNKAFEHGKEAGYQKGIEDACQAMQHLNMPIPQSTPMPPLTPPTTLVPKSNSI